MGRDQMSLQLVFKYTSGTMTSGTISGKVSNHSTTSSFAGKSLTGTFVLQRGLRSTTFTGAGGPGNCTSSLPLSTFPLSSLTLHTTN